MATVVNEFFVCLEDITANPGYLKGLRIFKMTAVALGPKHLSRQLRIVNAVVNRSPSGQIGWSKSVFLQVKDTLFETMMTTMNEVNRYKTKVPDYFFPVMFRLAVLLLNSMTKAIHNRWTRELIRDFKIWYSEAVVRRQIVKILPVTSWRVPVRLSRCSIAFFFGKVPCFTYSSQREYEPVVYFWF